MPPASISNPLKTPHSNHLLKRSVESSEPPRPNRPLKRSLEDSDPPRPTQSLKRPLEDPEPSRPRKRPGIAARISKIDSQAVLQRQRSRAEDSAKSAASIRGLTDVVRQAYNDVPERGREWRNTASKIKGLRAYNNWVKSTIIHKFSPNEGGSGGDDKLKVLDVGCGKGGDLQKWRLAPQKLGLYVGVDLAEVSIEQARGRYLEMKSRGGWGGGRGRGGRYNNSSNDIFDAHFFTQDAFTESLETNPLVRQVGFAADGGSRWGGGGGFDVVSMMFCMHYAFESEVKARRMLSNVAGSLKKGGRFLGVVPNSDVIRAAVEAFNATDKNATILSTSDEKVGKCEPKFAEWGNDLYEVQFLGETPKDGVFRPPFGWKYSYFIQEAVEKVPEYVVPWEAFRALAEDFNLELQYRKPFAEIWTEEKDDQIFGPLSERMGVRERGGELLVSEAEMEAAGFYHAFCFYKV